MMGFDAPLTLGDLLGCGLIRGVLALSGRPFEVCPKDRPGIAVILACHEMPADFDQESLAELLAQADNAIIDGRGEGRDNLAYLCALRAANHAPSEHWLIAVVECHPANELAWHHYVSPRVRILHSLTEKPQGRPDA